MKLIYVHGYSGSPENFCGLENKLAQQLQLTKQDYVLETLPGHSSEEELATIEYEDFYTHIKKKIIQINKSKAKQEEIILIGYSLGALLALERALLEKNISKVILISPAFVRKFPYNLNWKTKWTVKKKDVVTGLERVPIKICSLMNTSVKRIKNIIKKHPQVSKHISILCIESDTDIVSTSSEQFLKSQFIDAKIKYMQVQKHNKKDTHNPLSPQPSAKIIREMQQFIEST
jgi:esterase/lipase